MALPKSNIYLCQVPFSPTNQIDFADKTAQANYFNTLPNLKSYTNCTFIKRGQSLRLTGYSEREFDIYNYGFYDNFYGDTTRRYYFWIVSKRYATKNTTEFQIVIDAFQTFLGEWSFKDSFIERETTYSDKIGEHTLAEDCELGDYVTVVSKEVEEMKGSLSFFMGITDYNDELIGSIFGKMYNGYALKYYETSDIVQLNNDIITLSENGKADSILFIFSYPTRMFNKWIEENGIDKPDSGSVIGSIQAYVTITEKLVFPNIYNNLFTTTVNTDSYTAENNKLNCYPFTLLEVSAPNGSNAVYKLEDFLNYNEIHFKIDSTLSPNPVFSASPKYYKNATVDVTESIETSGYGLCSWNNDAYANWYAQQSAVIKAQSENMKNTYNTASTIAGNTRTVSGLNAEDIAIAQTTAGTLDALSQVFSLDYMGAGATMGKTAVGATTNFNMANRNAQNDYMNASMLNLQSYQNEINLLTASVESASVQPNQCKGDTSSSNLDVSRDTCTFIFRLKKIKPEYARIIDKKMKVYGYKVNRIGMPSITNRTIFDYLKTVGCQIQGNLRQEDKEMIERMFDNGLRIWHNPAYIYNYKVKNVAKGGYV